jgi:hypothetical protein
MPNAGMENSGDDSWPIKRQEQYDGTAMYKITVSSLTCEERQYAEEESDRASDSRMVI